MSITRLAAAVLLSTAAFSIPNFFHDTTPPPSYEIKPDKQAKIQVAILLDVSNSMDGLISQAKAQLWNMVSVLGKAKCDGATPDIQIALYEYGRDDNEVTKGYVKQISGFTHDLDQLSKDLFSLTTNGGEEYCGHVIYNSLTELPWDTASHNYKVIFIAGNEDFLQGDIHYVKACAAARQKGVLVNTIYCGDKLQGIAEHWNLGSECGAGSFTNIDPDATPDDIATPYDSTIFVLNKRLNETYIGYGFNGKTNGLKQQQVDAMNMAYNKSAAAERVVVKSKTQLYKNTEWDLVDASTADSSAIARVDIHTLPDSLQKKSRKEIAQVVSAKKEERALIQKQIGTLSVQREGYLAIERAKNAKNTNKPNLQTEIEKILRQQAARYRIVIQ